MALKFDLDIGMVALCVAVMVSVSSLAKCQSDVETARIEKTRALDSLQIIVDANLIKDLKKSGAKITVEKETVIKD